VKKLDPINYLAVQFLGDLGRRISAISNEKREGCLFSCSASTPFCAIVSAPDRLSGFLVIPVVFNV